MNETKYRRKNRKHSTISALTDAQQIVFAPLTFQAIGSMLDFGILQKLDEKPCTENILIKELSLNEYIVSTLLEIAIAAKIVHKDNNELYSLTQIGKTFLYDKMTRINFNFVRNICYLGASELTKSFENSRPEGLQKFFKDSETIYPILPTLPETPRKSWYEFDHYYSDNCYDIVYKIISDKKPKKIFDIGANTGKFEKTCLKYNPETDITLIDLAENINITRQDRDLKRCKFYAANLLEQTNTLPELCGAVLMSQFLDCFSKEQILSILKKVAKASKPQTRIYILEPFTDNQEYFGAYYSLVHTSLYFTCIANGTSKMYKQSEMETLIKQAGLTISQIHNNIGIHDYTLLECTKE